MDSEKRWSVARGIKPGSTKVLSVATGSKEKPGTMSSPAAL